MVEIKTDRLLLRGYEEKYAPRILEIINNKNIVRNMKNMPSFPYTLEKIEKCIKNMNLPENQDKNFLVTLDRVVIGGTGFYLKDGPRVGIASGECWLGEEYWGKGIATEVWDAIIDYIFENFDVRKISVGTFSWNPASVKILEKCGFSEEGCIEDEIIRFGEVCHECRYGLLKAEWEVLKNKI